jgi:hypothetical protein
MNKIREAYMTKQKLIKSLEKLASSFDPSVSKTLRWGYGAVAAALDRCQAATLWDVADRSYQRRLKAGKDPEVPRVDDFFGIKTDLTPRGKLAVVGLARCCRTTCPVCCYSKVIPRRNLALKWMAARDWSDYYGVFLTFTVPHTLKDSESADSFKPVLESLCKSLERFSEWFKGIGKKSRDGYMSPCPKDLGYLSTLEVTFGKNGLHPHFHVLLLTKSESDVLKLKEFFSKDRVRVWKSAGKSLLRMPDINEAQSFKIFLTPGENLSKEKVLSYLSKGLYETLSSTTKTEQKSETSKSIFNLSEDELKYFVTFFESTKGKRFYRAGGICREITKFMDGKDQEGEDKSLAQGLVERFMISAEKDGLDPGVVSRFVHAHRWEILKDISQLSGEEISAHVHQVYEKFKRKYFVDEVKSLQQKLEKSIEQCELLGLNVD